MNWYNDIDPKACAWTSSLIDYGLIPKGDVVCKSVLDIKPEELDDGKYRQFHFFNGIGGWPRALDLAGFPRGRSVWTASLPCQPFSVSGKKLAQKDERHLWPVFFDLVKARRPVLLLGEQVANASGFGWTDGVFSDLEGEGYACGQVVLGAHSVAAPHTRQRLYWVAIGGMAESDGGNASSKGVQRGGEHRQRAEDGKVGKFWSNYEWLKCSDGKARRIPLPPAEPVLQRLADGLPEGMDLCGADRAFPLTRAIPKRSSLLRGYGNSLVAPLATVFVRSVMEEIGVKNEQQSGFYTRRQG